MKLFLIAIIFFMASSNVLAQNDDASWGKDFTITFSFTGSMDGSQTKLTFTYDSMIYTRNSGMTAPKTDLHTMTASDRTMIIKKMKALKIKEVTSESNMAPVNDGWSEMLCYGSHCIQGGTSAKMTEKNKQIFSEACEFLQTFANGKSKSK
ncbi:hypothetical protein [Pseudochryseolinea flava]|nr:hypothetical protein [Pseudochryseolinea flava]